MLLALVTTLGVLAGPWAVRRSRASPIVALALVVVVAISALPQRTPVWPPAGWRVVACDVGQGDGLVLASGPGRAVLVDVGPEGGGIDACLRRLGVRTLDAVVLTHFHDDHVGDLAAAIDDRPVGRILVTPVDDPQWATRQVQELAAERSIPVTRVVAGGRLEMGEVSATAWWPGRVVAGGSAANNASIVLHVRVGQTSALLLGDIEQEAGHAMLPGHAPGPDDGRCGGRPRRGQDAAPRVEQPRRGLHGPGRRPRRDHQRRRGQHLRSPDARGAALGSRPRCPGAAHRPGR
uniref:MBL fold metallo-hydrolase n=1 Tax=Janibacter limosus TaxID=53458 RepID=A0AC61U8C2_9MICO|nr:MBL fold metallo-hydrolase [Janibacter limosus]